MSGPPASTVKLQTARLAANDLLSTYPNAQRSLESDLCTIFGFTPDTDITASPLSLDNSGRITKSLVSQHATDTFNNPTIGAAVLQYGIGHLLTNTSNSNTAYITYETEAGDNAWALKASPGITSRFRVNMDDGALTGSTTQDTSQTPLIPASSGVDTEFYDGSGHFSKPALENLSFNGCSLIATQKTIGPGATASQVWTETGGFDPNGMFDGSVDATKVTIGTTGKYFLTVSLPLFSDTPVDIFSVLVYVQKNAASTWALNQLYDHTSPIANSVYLQFSTVLSLVATDYLKVTVVNSSTGNVISGSDNGIVGFGHLFNGRFSIFRVE